jgi:hypothetical protein
MKLNNSSIFAVTVAALTLLSASNVEGHARGSSSVAAPFREEAPRQLMEDGGGGGGGGGGVLVETRDCLDLSKVNPTILSNGNTEATCLANSCDGGCCRVFSWMVCDTNNQFPHLSCVCNGNTGTKSPTKHPTLPPTTAPSTSHQPTPNPTDTQQPSEIPTSEPSTSPSSQPTDAPSSSPTIKAFSTEDTTDDQGNPVRASACFVAPEKLQFVTTATYTYDYELYTPDTVDPVTTVDALLSDQIHQALANKFLDCVFDEDALWIIHSAPHVVDTDSPCRGATPPGELCSRVTAVDTIWFYDAPGNRRQLQQPSQSLESFVTDINSFINNSMADGIFNTPSNITQLIYANDGSNLIVTTSPTSAPTPSVTDGQGNNQDTDSITVQNKSPDDNGPSTPVVAVLSVAGAAVLVVLFLIVARRKKRRQKQLDYLVKADLDLVEQVTSLEGHVDLDSVLGEEVLLSGSNRVSADPYTLSSPSRRSQRSPLYSQDELDQEVGNQHGSQDQSGSPGKQDRRYRASDTVNL